MTELPDRTPSERERLHLELGRLAAEDHELACWLLGVIGTDLPTEELAVLIDAARTYQRRRRHQRASLIRERFGGRSRLS